MKPIILYLDDEPRNLTVFEASLSEDWDVKIYSDPFKALEALENVSPWVIVTDQRMPGITGVKFLELAKKLHPNAIRIIVTGYSEEDLVVESVRKAQIFDYIKKPWEPEDLEASLVRAIDLFRANEEARRLHKELAEREAVLEQQNRDLMKLTSDLKEANQREQEMRKELECWVPPFLLWAIKEEKAVFPMKRDLVGITFDIIGSADLHETKIAGKPLRSQIIQLFSEAVIRNGGWRESHSGDSAYGHFGLLGEVLNPYEAALAAAREFRVGLRSFREVHGVSVECGIAIHVARDCMVDVHTVSLNTPRGPVIQKSFDTTSRDIDLLHRMEKLAHDLPGSNILMSSEFYQALGRSDAKIAKLGAYRFKGQIRAVEVYGILSDLASRTDVETLGESSAVIPTDSSEKKVA